MRPRPLFFVLALALGGTHAHAQGGGEGGPSAGRVAWLRADRGITTGFSNLVSNWADASGSGWSVFCNASESLPEWSRVEIGGQPALRFDGNDWLLGFAMPTGSYTKAVVCRIDDRWFANNVVSSLQHHALWFGASKRARLFHSGDFVKSDVDVAIGAPVVLVATYDAAKGVGRIWQDGVLVGSGFTKTGNWDSSLMLGAFGFENFMKGAIAEVLVYDRALDGLDLGQLQQYLQRRYFARAAPAIEWTDLPRPGQVLQRDAQSQAIALVKGQVTSPGGVDVTLEVTRDGAPWYSKTKPLTYGPSGRAAFSFQPVLNAGLTDHELSLFVGDGTTRELVARIPAVTVGDVYVVNGQSNAQASDYYFEQLANQGQSRWLRSFGSASIFGATPFDLHWDRADGESFWNHGSVGQWALRMGDVLVHQEQVPIAIVNGAVGGTSVWQHQRNDADPFDAATIYGRLHLRLVEAGVDRTFRALLWYQGESDAGSPTSWVQGWTELRNDWAADYPALDHVYVVQIRNDCGAGGQQLMELQRLLADLHADTTVMSTTAVPSHDGCHFLAAGYRELGERLARLLRRDFFAWSNTQEIDPPNPASAAWGDPAHRSIQITFRDLDDVLVFEAGAEANFTTELGDACTGGRVTGNVVTLALAAPSTAQTVSYRGHPFDGPWLKNARGVGALCFEGLAIQ